MRLFAHALDEERDAHVRAPLAEAVAAQAGRDDVDRLDAAQRALRLGSAWRTASSELSVELPTSSMIFVTAMVRTYRDHGNGAPARRGADVGGRRRAGLRRPRARGRREARAHRAGRRRAAL